MSKNQKNTGPTSTFYKLAKAAREIRAGFLYKSPPRGITTERSWKRRYFVLFKVNEQEHHLKYFRGPEEMERPIGEIDLAHLSLLHPSPQNHPKWSWIQRNFKCSASCVLYLKSRERDYFLVGENREEVDGWFSVLFDALKNRPHCLHDSEEVPNGKIFEVISRSLARSTSACTALKLPKLRSMSAPSSNTLESDSEKAKAEDANRRASAPVPQHYVYPRPFNRQIRVVENNEEDASKESLYEIMMPNNDLAGELDVEVEEVISGTLMKTVTDVFERMRKEMSPLPPCTEERADGDRQDKRQSSEFSSSSSENGATSPVESLDRSLNKVDKQSSTESIEPVPAQERDIEVKQADLKKHLTLTEVDGKPSVSGWTGQQHTACLFHKGDQILAINDLHTGNLEDVNMYLSKSLKNQVKVTILRLPGCQPLHLGSCFCGDSS